MKKRERGFTLIELLVVITILGVLGGVAVPRVMGAVENARRNANIANQAILQSAVERYQVQHATWPVTGGALPATGVLASIDAALLADFVQGGVLPRINVVSMPPLLVDGDTWALDSRGVVVIRQTGSGNAVRWQP